MTTLTVESARLLDDRLPPELTPDMREVALTLFAALLDGGAPAAGAAQLAAEQVQRLSDELGGSAVYIPRGLMVRLGARDREMVARFTGRNYRELARDYGLTEMRVRRIISSAYAERIAKAQGKLPL